MKLRELAERVVGNTDVSALPPGTIGLEGDRAWSACFEAFMRLLGDAEFIGLSCKTCGGKRFIAKPSGDLPDAGSTFTPCPDCPPLVVVAPEAMEAGVAAAWEYIHPDLPWSELGIERQESARDTFAAGLGQLGIVVADEVVEAWDGGGIYDRQGDFTVGYGRGDKLYIERATVTRCDTSAASTRCPDTSKDALGIDKGESDALA